MKRKIFSILLTLEMVLSFSLISAVPATAAAPELPVNLGLAGDFVIFSSSGISTTGTTLITGNIGLGSGVTSTAFTGFDETLVGPYATSPLVVGKLYARDYTPPTPTYVNTAEVNMLAAYDDAFARTIPDETELGNGDISGMTLAPGLYKWGTGVLIDDTGVTLSGGADDVWIFQISGDLTVSNGAIVHLSGGAEAKNIFWAVTGQTTLGTTSEFNGNILCKTLIAMNTGAQLTGRALAQTAVTLDANTVTMPAAPTTTVIIDSATVKVGATGSVEVWVMNYPLVPAEAEFGLGAYDITVNFNPVELTIDSVGPGTAPFNAPIGNIPVPPTGSVQIAQFQTASMTEPYGDILLCTLNFTCNAESVSLLDLTVNDLTDADGATVLNTAVDGTITQILSSIAIAPTTGPRGTMVTVTGAGFDANETGIAVTWDGAATEISGVTADGTGAWTDSFVVPAGALAGDHIIDASGDVTPDTDIADRTFTVISTVEVGDATVSVGSTGSVEVWVMNYPLVPAAAEFGLGAYDITINFNPAELTIDSVDPGTAPFNAPIANIPVPPTGSVQIAQFQTASMTEPDGDILICILNFTCNAESTSILDLTVNDLTDADGATVAHVAVDGTVTQIPTSITIDPALGPRGTEVTVTGTGFGADETGIAVTFAGVDVITDIPADASGDWGPVYFDVPADAVLGANVVDAYGSVTGPETVPDLTFTVSTPVIAIDPAAGPMGTSVDVTGTNFAVGETGIAVLWDGGATSIIEVTADATGAWGPVIFTVPEDFGGAHAVDASGDVTPAVDVADQTFTITPTLAIDPAAGLRGTEVTVTGTGFAADETGIAATFAGLDVLTGITAGANGSWTDTFIVPDNAIAGANAVDAYSATTLDTAVPDASFNVTPTVVTIDPVTGPVGTTVAVSGTGFIADETGIAVTYDGTDVITGITADASGAFGPETFDVPASSTGAHIVDASSVSTTLAQVTGAAFTVTPAIVVDPIAAPINTPVAVTGTGFGASETGIAVTWDGNPTTIVGVTANPNGSWGPETFTVPADATFADSPYAVSAYGDDTPNTAVPDIDFTVTETSIALDPNFGPRGTEVEITGTMFEPGETVTVAFDVTEIITGIVPDVDGNWGQTYTIPTTVVAGNIYNFTAVGTTTPADNVPPAPFTVSTPAIALNPAAGPRGTTVTVTGSNFAVDEDEILVTYAGATVETDITAGATGGWTATFDIPPTSALGDNDFDASGAITQAAEVADQTFTVSTPAITIDPVEGLGEDIVTVTGTNFAVGETEIAVTWDGGATTIVDVTAEADGTWGPETFEVPADANVGAHTVDASGAITDATEVADQTFNVMAALNLDTEVYYTTIQGAIDDALDGEAILVLPGTHTEAITVDKELVIGSEGAATTIIDASTLGTDAVTITADGVVFGIVASQEMKGLTIQGASENGILINADGCLVQGNVITANDTGVFVATGATGNVLMYNDITGNTKYGVYDEAGASVDATYNWWGDISGPDGAGAGVGDTISAGVSYEPWLSRVSSIVVAGTTAYIGWEQDLALGWNIYSTPIALDGLANEWADIKALGDTLAVHATSPAYYFDPTHYESGVWMPWRVVTATTVLKPLDAIYVRMAAADTSHIIVSPDPTAPSKTMYPGWNLVGLANLTDMPVEDALASVEIVTGDLSGYAYAVSPAINQPEWTYWQGDVVVPDMVVGKGYWVFMINQGILGGFTFTPLVGLP